MTDDNNNQPHFCMRPLDDPESLNANKGQAKSKSSGGWGWVIYVLFLVSLCGTIGRMAFGMLGAVVGPIVGVLLAVILYELMHAVRALLKTLFQTRMAGSVQKVLKKSGEGVAQGYNAWYRNYRDR